MPLKSKNLKILAYTTTGFTLWHYTTTDLMTDVLFPGYFNNVSDQLRVGDMVIVNADTEVFTETAIVVVTQNSDDVVKVVAMSLL